ncbi:hypothetical protein [Streptomyces sp. NPDC051776]|uniref:SCO4983 family protein n=1 Tax=Streptomyces sp. NPDC051776 TaxID=3155414 RepID=UPI00343B69DE
MYEPIRTKSVHSTAEQGFPHRSREEELDIQLAGHLAALLSVTDDLRAGTPAPAPGLDRAANRIAEQVARLRRGASPARVPEPSEASGSATESARTATDSARTTPGSARIAFGDARTAALHRRAHALAGRALVVAASRADTAAAILAAEQMDLHAAALDGEDLDATHAVQPSPALSAAP